MAFLIPFVVTLFNLAVWAKLSMPLIWLVEKHDATMQPHFNRSVFQNLNFSVFDHTDNCRFHIFHFVAVTSTFINNCAISVSERKEKKGQFESS